MYITEPASQCTLQNQYNSVARVHYKTTLLHSYHLHHSGIKAGIPASPYITAQIPVLYCITGKFLHYFASQQSLCHQSVYSCITFHHSVHSCCTLAKFRHDSALQQSFLNHSGITLSCTFMNLYVSQRKIHIPLCITVKHSWTTLHRRKHSCPILHQSGQSCATLCHNVQSCTTLGHHVKSCATLYKHVQSWHYVSLRYPAYLW